MKRFIALLVVGLLGSTSLADITVTPPKANVGEKVIATVEADIPEGAMFDGGWDISCDTANCRAQWEVLAQPDSIGIWGPAGNYKAEYSGFWLLLEEVSFVDGNGNEITIQSYLGHGFIDESATFVLEGDDSPDPPDPPDPDPVGPWKIVLFYDSAKLDDATPDQQAVLRGESVKAALKERGHELVQRVEGHPTTYPSAIREFVDAVRGKSLPRVALQSPSGGAVYEYPLPETWKEFLDALNNPRRQRIKDKYSR